MKINTLLKQSISLISIISLFTACSGDKKSGKMQNAKGMNAPQIANYIVLRDTTLSETIQITGTIEANESVDLRAEMTGKVKSILFSEGTRVNKGDLLVKINDDELKAQFDRAKARLKLAEEQEYRQRTLLKKEAISQQEYDMVFTELQTMRAESALLKAQLAKTEIRAPFTGKLGLRMISEGDFISSSSTITKLVNDDIVKITFSIPEKYANHIKAKSEIEFALDGNSKNYKANVYAIDPSIDENTRTLKIRAKTKNDGAIIPGSFCKVSLELNQIPNAILAPNESIIPILKGKKVFISKNGKASEVTVKTGIRTDRYIQITDGLKAGDTLITSGILSLKEGSSLRLK